MNPLSLTQGRRLRASPECGAISYRGNSVSGERSPDISNIQVPVLLQQGTADTRVPWQTVESFYQDMKSQHKRVTLDLFPGGHHGLHGVNAKTALQDVNKWLSQHGA